ncbi:type II secretion system minor pseudopilin GspK [Gammaproteobacteria bacterium]|nr:type II secretion system minor pseudopilin GspK [Gammaproteobacteria bacterium]
MPSQRRLYRQTGVALLAALILMLAVVLTLGNIFYRHQIDVSRLSRTLHRDQALLLALSVENWAGQLLSSEQDEREVDSLDENWAMAVPILPVEGGYIRGCLIDLQSRINLNSFGSYDSERWANEMDNAGNGLVRTWLALLRNAELPSHEGLAASIIDWVDENTEPVNQWGAEQITYDVDRSALMVANSALTEVAELVVIKGFNLAMVQQVQPWLTVLPLETAININTAPETLLLAMGGEYSQRFAEFVMTGRPFDSVESFQQSLATFLTLPGEQVTALWPEEFVTVKSDYFQLTLQVTLGEAQLEVHSILDRYNLDEPVVISRTVSVIPDILPGALSATSRNDNENSSAQQGFCVNTGLES